MYTYNSPWCYSWAATCCVHQDCEDGVFCAVEAMPVKAERGRRAKGPVADKSPAKKTRGRKAATKSATPDPTPVIETMSPGEWSCNNALVDYYWGIADLPSYELM